MTNGTPATTAARNDPRSGSFGVVTLSTTLAVKSVFPVTRPSPGKCLAAVATPAEAIPVMNAAPCAPLPAGVEPNSLSSAPIGAFDAAVAAGTTSITGARSKFTPAARSSRAQTAAAERSVAVDQVPWVSADGITEKPGPVSCWTWPPSWLAAMNIRTPPSFAVPSDCNQEGGQVQQLT